MRGVAARLVGLAARLRGAGVGEVTSAGVPVAFRGAALRAGVVRALGAAGATFAAEAGSSPLTGSGCSALVSLARSAGVRWGCRGRGRSGSGGWNSTAGAALARRGRGVAGAAAGAAVDSVGSTGTAGSSAAVGSATVGALKVARGERRRARSAGSRRVGSLGGCSCISMERSPDHAGAQRGITGGGRPWWAYPGSRFAPGGWGPVSSGAVV